MSAWFEQATEAAEVTDDQWRARCAATEADLAAQEAETIAAGWQRMETRVREMCGLPALPLPRVISDVLTWRRDTAATLADAARCER